MKHLQLILLGLGCVFLASEANSVVSDRNLSADKGIIYQAKNFKCPLVFGAFPDPDDCSYFYVCVAGVSVHRKCGILQHFDVLRRRCMPIIVAICGIDKSKTTPATTTTSGDNFKCPKFMGSFPHPNDCSKYYTCTLYIASLKTCPENQLFDIGKSSCKPEEEVNCDTRQRPGYLTSAIPIESTTTDIPETNSIDEDIIQTTDEIIGTEVETTESTLDISSTMRPTGPPDHTCDEDDVDCIITETGDIEVWFICPRDIGSFPHPSSDKLFIFCMNWIPSVKKCGLNLVYSKEMSTCVETTYFVKLLL